MKYLFIFIAIFCASVASLPCNAQHKTEPITYIVQPKNGLWGIAKQFNVTVEDIKRWNNLPSNNIIIGQTLVVGFKEVAPVQPSEPSISKELEIINEPEPENSEITEPSLDYKSETVKEPTIEDEEDYQTDEPREEIPDTYEITSTKEEPPIAGCLLGSWESKEECPIYTANSNFFEFNDDGTGRYGITECEHPYNQYIYTFQYSVSGKIIKLREQKEVFGGSDGEFMRDDILFFVCPEDYLLLSGVKYQKR